MHQVNSLNHTDQLRLAAEAFQAGNAETAEDICRQILNEEPGQGDALHLLGILSHKAGRLDESIASFERSLKAKPGAVKVRLDYADILRSADRIADAIDVIQAARKIDPTSEPVHLNLAKLFAESMDWSRAIESYQAVLERNPDSLAAWIGLGNICTIVDQYEEALQSFQRAAEIRPDDPGIHYNIGNTYSRLEQFDTAINSYFESLRLRPGLDEVRTNLGVALYRCDRFEEAIEHLSGVETPLARSTMLDCFYALQRFDKFFGLVEKLRELDDVNANSAATSAYVAQQFGREDLHPFCPDPLSYVRVIENPGQTDDLDALVGQLVEAVSRLDVAYEPRSHATKLGYHSVDRNLFSNPTGPLAVLKDVISREINNYYEEIREEQIAFARRWPEKSVLYGWYIHMLPGGHQLAHIHPTGWLSGVIHLSVPTESRTSDAGRIEFMLKDPEKPAINDEGPRVIYEPKPGQLLLFPSSLLHQTIPFESDEPRQCIAFDLRPG